MRIWLCVGERLREGCVPEAAGRGEDMKLFTASLETQYAKAEKKINSLLKVERNGATTCKAEDDAFYVQHHKSLNAAIDLRDELLEKLDKICIDKLNSFSPNRPCTIIAIADRIGIPWYRVKRVMMRTIPADTPDLRDILSMLNILAPGKVGKKVVVCDDYEIPVIILPNWRFVVSSDTDIEYVERMEKKSSCIAGG